MTINKIFKVIIIAAFLFLLPGLAQVELFSAEPQYILIKKPGQYIRAEATDTAKVIAKAKEGDAFKVVTLKENYFEIILPGGGEAYVPIDVASIITVKELVALRAKRAQKPEAVTEDTRLKDKYVQIVEYRTELRAAPKGDAKILMTTMRGAVFKILSLSAGWYEILLPPDRKAYVDSNRVAVIGER